VRRPEVSGRLSFCILLVSQFVATMGFTFVMPFMPIYVQQLGVSDAGHAAAWAGILNTAQAATMALTAPLWGRLGDRFGQKTMLMRATIAGAIVVGLMGLATSPWHVLGLRLLQGCLTGTVAAATVLVSASATEEKAGSRLGAFQTMVFIAAAAGPFVGGLFAEVFGMRNSFGVTSALLAASGLLVMFGVSEVRNAREGDEKEEVPEGPLPWRVLMPGLFALFVVNASTTAVIPAIPGFLDTLMESSRQVAGLSGQIIGTGALAAALGSFVGGRLAERYGTRRMIFCALTLAGMASLPQAMSENVAEFWGLRIVASFFLGSIIPVANLVIRESVSRERQGAAFGVAASATSVAFGVGPLGGGFLASAFGFSVPFLVPGAMLLGASAVLLFTPRKRAKLRFTRAWKAMLAHLHLIR
jgi:DHA1 family multidrug resistance protein-like MFS transporter